MGYEDDLRAAGRYQYGDVLAGADWRLAELKNSSSCVTCGSPDPAIIEGRYCSDCVDEDAEAFEEAWTNREGMPEFNGAFR